MGLFDSVRGFVGDDDGHDVSAVGDSVPRPNVHSDPTPTDFRNKAVDAVQQWDCELDFSTESLVELHEFADTQGARLDVLKSDGTDSERVATMHTSFAIRAGSYLGEVLVREFDGKWVQRETDWVVTVPDDNSAITIDVFEIAAHSFAEQPLFVDTARRLGADFGPDEEDDDDHETGDVRPEFKTEAVEFATFWDQYDLDQTPLSLARLDVLVDSEWDSDRFSDAEAGGDDMDSQMFTELVKQTGSYYGEVLVRTLDATWTRKSEEIVVTVPSASSVPDVTVPVFDTANDVLTAASEFTAEYESVVDRADRDAPAVPTQPTQSGDNDVATEITTAETATTQPADTAQTSPTGRTDDDPLPAELRSRARGATADTDPVTTDPDSSETVADSPASHRPAAPDTHRDDPDSSAVESTTSSPVDDRPTFDLGTGSADDTDLTVTEVTEDASAFAATWPGYDLDFTPDSLSRLDRLVSEEYDAADVPAVDVDAVATGDAGHLSARIVEAGGYFAEVLRRDVGGDWLDEDGLLFVVRGRTGETHVDPIELATDCFRGDESFADAHAAIRDNL